MNNKLEDLESENNTILACKNLWKSFGGMVAVKDLDFHVYKNEIFGIAGPNGAGKTTLFNILTQILPLDRGTVWFNGRFIEKLPPYEICRLGLTRTFQIPEIFKSLTVYKNVLVGSLFGTTETTEHENYVQEALKFVGLVNQKDKMAEELSLYERKLLMIATALSSKPKLLMLDEPIAGLSQIERSAKMKLIEKLRQEGLTIILIEHNMDVLMGVSDRVMILDHGEKICEGSPEMVCNNEQVITAYLGEKYEIER